MNSPRRKAHRYVRFSVRGLLVLVTAVAVWLGLECKRVRDQRIAVNRVIELEGGVRYEPRGGQTGPDAAQPGWPWLRSLIGDDYFQHVVQVGLDNTDVTDADLQYIIGRLRKVRALSLNFTNISDEGLVQLPNARQMRYLGLAETRVTDTGLQYIASCGNLEDLVLENTYVGDDGVTHLKGLTKLKLVNLSRTSITSAGIADLAGLENLIALLAYETLVDDSAIQHFKRMSDRLSELHVSGTQFSGLGLIELKHSLPSCNITCEVFDLSGSTGCTERWTKYVGRIHALDDESRLKALDLSDTPVGDEEVAALHDLKNVQLIDLRGTSVSDSACQRLRSALLHCHVCR